MNSTYFQDLYNYNFWAHRRVWACIEQLSDDQFTHDPGHSIASIRDQCIHTMAVEWWWFHFLQTGTLVFLNSAHYPSRASIRTQWDNVEHTVRAYLHTLTDPELERQVRPDFWNETRQPIKVWQALLQVANHGTDHRAQILAGIRHLGGPTVEQDYLSYLFARQGS